MPGRTAASVAAGGTRLPIDVRSYFEPRFGHDFSQVRLHTQPAAAAAARSIGARAFTSGRDVAFAAGEYAPQTRDGRRLIAHELAHVVQNDAGVALPAVRRQPAPTAPDSKPDSDPQQPPGTEPVRPPGESNSVAKDLLAYPLFVDLWNDIFRQKLTDKDKKEFKLKGVEGAAFWNVIWGGANAGHAAPAGQEVGAFFKSWVDHAQEVHKLAGGSDLYLDAISQVVGLNIESYLGSDLFVSRLKSHPGSVATLFALAQTGLSTYHALAGPGAAPGEFEPTQWEKQSGLVKTLANTVLKAQFTAPDFFDVGPLKLKLHPAYAFSAPSASGVPSGLTFEHKEGEGMGQGGSQLKAGVTANLAQLAKGATSSTDVADLQKNRGWQGSLWGTYDNTDPTQLMAAAGKVPEANFRAGAILGTGGYLGTFEAGGHYGGKDASELTSWFLRGGFGYSGKKGDKLQKIGFDAVYTDWTETDVLAPRVGVGESPAAGNAFKVAPFAKIELGSGDRHKFSAGAALGFVTGTHENFGLRDFRGDLSYVYMGDRSKDALPVFKLDLSGSLSRLDWWNPDSPLLTGIQARVGIGDFYAAGQVMTGAAGIPEDRARQIDVETKKVKVPTGVLFTAGFYF